MLTHDHFEELCSLAVLGGLGREEYEELAAHLRTCRSCEAALRDFTEVVQHLPLERVPPTEAEYAELQESVSTDKFLARAKKEGVLFSPEACDSLGRSRWRQEFWRKPILTLSPAMAAMLIAGLLVVAVSAGWNIARQRHSAFVAEVHPVAAPTAALTPPATAADPSELASAVAMVRNLQNQLARLKQTLLHNKANIRFAKDRADSSEKSVRERDATISDLLAKVEQQTASIAQANSALQEAQTGRDQAIAWLVEQQQQIQSLQSEIKLALAKADQERQLNEAAKDVREVMGARKLHIIDVYDSENPDQASKSFGRIIYTENKSLIFYAFDLDQLHHGTKVFVAWGERSGQQGVPRSLGSFSLDDEKQKRWVLRIDDFVTLKAIDTVFVTVESHVDPIRPSERHYLQAYLGARANHP